MKKKFLSLFFITAILLTCLCSSTSYASSNTPLGYGWSTRPITVYAASNLTTFEKTQLQNAINSWNGTYFGTYFIYGGTLPEYSIVSLPGICGVIKSPLPGGSNVRF